ncbi:HAD family hydrolase [Marinibactrum halimedae]|uniref:Haloacid dehalogenase n=1 Tax=Marinibactrum halimedae TaxID=1444977 RepID=A0AA37WNN9_9GAMM|nr:HAD family hydrolase [Marinibactrum halimedae]MCD9458858.1 HAD family hydrolase [Marinibactrum halimedae]GLS27710.1 haloacid dehalogenase [Marinibactrum halimedae]
MLKALFLDMDETLCDTQGANHTAKQLLQQSVMDRFTGSDALHGFADDYVLGIYREWTEAQRARYLPIIESTGEMSFRIQLIQDLLSNAGVPSVSNEEALALQKQFDDDRIQAFDFYPGIPEFLSKARQYFTLVVITNGPEFSQVPKVERINLSSHVDHIIIGGQEPEQKPARSIFEKALTLAQCEAHEAIHVGDSLAADIVGAHNAGITSVWIQHQQPLDAELGINPHHTVLHPDEIPALIQELTTQPLQ